jgi:hypothetical protein
MVPFCYVVLALVVELSEVIAKQSSSVQSRVANARYPTVLLRLTYPLV